MKKTDYIATFPQEVQERILEDAENFHFSNGGIALTEVEKEEILSCKLCDLEEIIDIEKYI